MYKRNTCAIRLGAMMLLLSGAMNAHATLIGDEVDVLVTVPVNNGGFTVIDGTETVSDSVVEFPFSSNIITNLNMSVDFGESSVALRVKNDLPVPQSVTAPLGIVFELDNLNWLGFDGGIVNVVGLRNTLPIADVSFDEDSIRIATVADLTVDHGDDLNAFFLIEAAHVPEPTTIPLVGIGLLGLAAMRSRAKRGRG